MAEPLLVPPPFAVHPLQVIVPNGAAVPPLPAAAPNVAAVADLVFSGSPQRGRGVKGQCVYWILQYLPKRATSEATLGEVGVKLTPNCAT